MSEEYDNTNKGVLFTNSYKESPKQPDVKGELDVEGVAYKMAGWIRTKRDSTEKFFSISVELRDKLPPAKNDRDPIGEVMGGEAPLETQNAPVGNPEALQDDTGGEDVPF